MLVLGIETSCDETAAAVVEDGQKLLSNTVASSVDLHAAFGGVVPEIAARSHLEVITPVIEEALQTAKVGWPDIDAIAVTQGPGLAGSLLIGVLTVRTLAITKGLPLYGINHVGAHVYANFITSTASRSPASGRSPKLRERSLRDAALEAPGLTHRSSSTTRSAPRSRLASHQSAVDVNDWKLGGTTYTLPAKQPSFPLLALIVSGGHTQLVLFKDHFDYTVLGRTLDDAVGEAFDKVAKILGLPYPGGPSVAKAAAKGNPTSVKLPQSRLENTYDFSYSGLKTAVLRAAQELAGQDYTFPSHQLPKALKIAQKHNLAASFQATAVAMLIGRLKAAAAEFKPQSIVIAGGVAANQHLRAAADKLSPAPIYTDIRLCTDNAAMVAALGYFKAIAKVKPDDPYSLEIKPDLSM